MAKHKAQRALFELLVKRRGQVKAKPDTRMGTRPAIGAQAVTPPEQAAEMPRREEPAPITRRPMPAMLTRKAAIIVGGVRLTWPYLVIAGVVLVCLCYLFYALGARQRGDGLPATEKHPTLEEIQSAGPVPGLVGPAAERPKLGTKVPPKPGPGTERTRPPGPATQPPSGDQTPPATAGPQYRVRIARIDVTQAGTMDDLRAYLAKSGVQTETVTRSGYHILYSRQYFTDKATSDALALEINKTLEAFEKETRRPTSKDAYTVQTK
ncbi:MAG: hypothetical protein AMS14_09965 [Planctomycetes bacterium DG_20]|nr:MAG: hypothetical protein AMS14_09965 [Planctomycetes bacterium DG_20]